MKAQTYFANLKRAVTGTTVGSSHAADVYIANTTLPVAFSAITMKEYRFQKMSDTAIPASGGTAIEIGDSAHVAADIATTCTQLKCSNNSGGAFNIYKGANSGALTLLAAIAQGQTSEAVFGVALVATDKVWVRAIENTAISSGQILVTFF